uniref:Uncharacterized protein n=1 Tax=Janibacter limosus TaxID=53458 RepID=A0AC61U3R1_9MICO|nr:helix-turn-helix domain-containing protein [Janibacter limosus]
MNLRSLASGIGSLSDDTRRELYEYVVGRGEPVTGEEAATATGLRPHKANFHLDRLVEEGLLEVEYRRLTGRTGPGAGRPSKLYRRSEEEFSLSLPPRRYDHGRRHPRGIGDPGERGRAPRRGAAGVGPRAGHRGGTRGHARGAGHLRGPHDGPRRAGVRTPR